jgi:hypothetical protein
MSSHARISIVQLLAGAIAVMVSAIEIAAPAAQAADRKPCAQPLVMPMVIAARYRAHIPHNTLTSGAGCGVRLLRGALVSRTLILTVQIYAPGRVTVSGKNLRTVSRRLSMASTTTLRVALSRAGLRALRHHRRPKIDVRVDFVPKQKGESRTTIGPTSKQPALTGRCGYLSCHSSPTHGSSSTVGISGSTAVVPSPTTTPGPTPRVIFSGNWETGDISQWAAAQCANTGLLKSTFLIGTINIVKDIVAQGKYAARFDMTGTHSRSTSPRTGGSRVRISGASCSRNLTMRD